jgi:DNA modification methylase
MKEIPVSQLIANELTDSLYGEDEAFDRLVKSVEIHGILEPLLVQPKAASNHFEVISGNRRLRASLVLGLTELPCIVRKPVAVDANLIMAHQEQRIKTLSETLMESVALYELHGMHFKQGMRLKTKEDRVAREKRTELEKKAGGKHVVKALLKINELINELTAETPHLRAEYLKKLDKGKSIRGTTLSLERELAEKKNRQHSRKSFDIKIGDVTIYNRSSLVVDDLETESVQLIITSPPYFAIRDYGLGQAELGHEAKVVEFIERLCQHMNLYHRLLKPDGTMWVNLGDFVLGYGYEMVAERFALKMIDEYNWKLHDKIVWVKNNPVFTNSNRTVLANEFIYVFKKNDFVKFNLDWVKETNLQDSKVTIGQAGGKIKLRSVFDFRENIVQTNVANNHELAKACEASGLALTHHATFPISIPTIAVLTGSDPGDLVMDPFSGTATTARSTQMLNRRFVGFELSPTYQLQGEVRLMMPIETDMERAA